MKDYVNSFFQKICHPSEGKDTILFEPIHLELAAGRIDGPISEPPFQNIQVSPLGIIPKKAYYESRLIHHLSYPEGNSINDYIQSQFCIIQYQTIDTAISLIQKIGPG